MALCLRRICEEDLEKIMHWRMTPEVTKYMYTDCQLTLDGQRKWFNKIMRSKEDIYWIIQMDGVDIGLINMTDIDYQNKRCAWAYYIADTSFRGRGIATRLECNIYDFAFGTLKLNKVCCEVFCFNEKVISIHQKFGADIEGKRKEHICKNGQYYDIVQMGINKEKWQSIRDQYKYEKIEIDDYFSDKNEAAVCTKYVLGQSDSFSKTITESDVVMFAGITGDFNSLHVNDIEAAKSLFGKRVCHGMLVASYISSVLGNYFPGRGTVYLSQNIAFKNPAYIGDTVTARVTVKEILGEDIILLDTNVCNQKGEMLVAGDATVKVPIDC